MANLFDSLQDNVFNVVTNTMGYDASWQPEGSDTVYTRRVLFNDPTDDKDKISDQEYTSLNPQVEYKEGEFPGLYEAIRASNGGQTIAVNGINYTTLTVKRKYDGKTIIVDVTQQEL